LQEKGNQYVKMGKKHYSDAVDCYTRAIDQKVLSDSEHSILFSNRAHVNLLLGNYRRALMDAEEAIKLFPENVKVVILCLWNSQLDTVCAGLARIFTSSCFFWFDIVL
jgi:tetratricopeptide (TPR) repeat protein